MFQNENVFARCLLDVLKCGLKFECLALADYALLALYFALPLAMFCAKKIRILFLQIGTLNKHSSLFFDVDFLRHKIPKCINSGRDMLMHKVMGNI